MTKVTSVSPKIINIPPSVNNFQTKASVPSPLKKMD